MARGAQDIGGLSVDSVARPSHPRSMQMVDFVHASERLVGRAAAGALDLVSHMRKAITEVREQRRKLEAELFRNRYRISSKNDDDLPIVR
jgi:hypothetical protein